MSDDRSAAAILTARLQGIDGVVRIFPRHPVAATLRVVTQAPPALVEVDQEGHEVVVAARIGISRTTPTRAVMDRVVAALSGSDELSVGRMDIEIAYID